MSALESIVEELKTLPPKKLAVAADYIHQLKSSTDAERHRALDRAYGCLTEEEADSMEKAIETSCERIDASQW
jgi:hypothetical protein